MNKSDNKRPLDLRLGGLFILLLMHTPLISAETIEVEIRKYQFRPSLVTIQSGDSVRWINRERRQYHSINIQQDGSTEELIKSGYLFPGEEWEHRFAKPGVYSYHCGPHEEMTGRVVVP